MVFRAGDGKHRAEILNNGDVLMSMSSPLYKSDNISPEGISGFFIDSGARHFVCESQLLDDEYVFKMGKKVRHSDVFQPRGVNVNFYHKIKANCIKIKTYEKGVERVMLSCASGSAAVVFHLSQINVISSPTTTQSDGGKLIFTFDKKWANPWVKGPAVPLFAGAFETDMLI
jgi:diaminopimelate epimerase